jgi:hypothetical protein
MDYFDRLLIMRIFIKKHLLTFIGIPVGVLGGYLYYHFYGCTNGCAITSSPVNSMLYGAMMGGLLFNIFEGKKKS